MTAERMARPMILYLLMACLLFQGISGILGGIGLVGDPSGASVGIPIGWLEGSPFDSYLIPGLILLLVLGLFPLVGLYGLWTAAQWSWPAAVLVGLFLVGWIGVEILIIGYQPQPPLQLIYGLLGIAITLIALHPTVRHHYSRG